MIGESKLDPGYSLFEMLIAVFLFTILAVIITQTLSSSLRGSKKSENISEVKQSLEHSLAVMERHIRSGAVDCGSSTAKLIVYDDYLGNTANFSCDDSTPNDWFIASNSARLTSQRISITTTDCQIFTCTAASGGVPASVDITITASDISQLGAEGSTLTLRTKILTRDY